MTGCSFPASGYPVQEEAGHHGGMVSRPGRGGRTALDHEVGSGTGGESVTVLCPADEYQMGQLYPAHAQNSSQ
jgi:hypothetical protein